MRTRGRTTLACLGLAVVLMVCSACAFPVTGRALAAPQVTAGVDPSFIVGTDGGPEDRLAAATLRDLEEFWRTAAPALAGGRPFAPPRSYHSVDTSRGGPPPPCTSRTQEVEGTAFFCPRADVIVWDRSALLPVLRGQFGDSAVVVVLAHEFGHAVQTGIDQGVGTLAGAPTILLEAQADCYAGVFLRQVRDGALPDLRTGTSGIDAAMAALVTFRDPVGTSAGNADAHGNAFDRVSSFQSGFDGQASTCAGMSLQNRQFTQRQFSSAADESTSGNLPLPQLVQAIGPDLERFFGGLVTARGGRWAAPPLQQGSATCTGDDGEVQGPVAWCADPPSVRLDGGAELATLHRTVGDYATGTLLASRYGAAALAALGRPTTGPDAGRSALCLAGAYTGAIGTGNSGFGLSPGDLDEAVSLLLRTDEPVRGTDGVPGGTTGYDRVAEFRDGVDAGPDACLAGR